MSVTLSVGSLKICAFTLVVIQVSSMYSPVLDCCDVEAQPSAETIRAITKNPEKRLSMVITNLLSVSFCVRLFQRDATLRLGHVGVCSSAHPSGRSLDGYPIVKATLAGASAEEIRETEKITINLGFVEYTLSTGAGPGARGVMRIPARFTRIQRAASSSSIGCCTARGMRGRVEAHSARTRIPMAPMPPAP